MRKYRQKVWVYNTPEEKDEQFIKVEKFLNKNADKISYTNIPAENAFCIMYKKIKRGE